MSIDIDQFDFGFTAVDETELTSYQQAEKKVERTTAEAENLQSKCDNLYNAPHKLIRINDPRR